MHYSYFDEVQQWYVIFFRRGKPRHRWFHWFLRDDFVHCATVRQIDPFKTLLIEVKAWGVISQIVNQSIEDYLLNHLEISSAILGFTVDYRRQAEARPRGIINCVTLTKAILGLWNCPFVQTPFALYKLLLQYPLCTVVKAYVPHVRL